MIYFDSSALISLFIKRKYSHDISEFIRKQNEPIHIWSFGLVEYHSALKQLLKMGEITECQRQTAIIRLEVEINLGRIYIERNLDVNSIHELAILLIDKPAYKERALDTIHVASAMKLKSSCFVSSDYNQQELARREKLIVAPNLEKLESQESTEPSLKGV